MSTRTNRRRFLGQTGTLAAAAAASRVFSAPHLLAQRSPNSVLNIAGIGVAGRGGAHVQSALSENLIALCDAVEGHAQGSARRVEKYNKEHNLDRPLPDVMVTTSPVIPPP